ncbi:MAG: hypothetical protein MZV70_40705 [Desulfobacterales bacterium]|nr:hypothetical protein [Desulfobacterales bacterium]
MDQPPDEDEQAGRPQAIGVSVACSLHAAARLPAGRPAGPARGRCGRSLPGALAGRRNVLPLFLRAGGRGGRGASRDPTRTCGLAERTRMPYEQWQGAIAAEERVGPFRIVRAWEPAADHGRASTR